MRSFHLCLTSEKSRYMIHSPLFSPICWWHVSSVGTVGDRCLSSWGWFVLKEQVEGRLQEED